MAPKLPGTSVSRVFKRKTPFLEEGGMSAAAGSPGGASSCGHDFRSVLGWEPWLSEHRTRFPLVWREVSLGSQCQAKDCPLSSRRSPLPRPGQAAPPWAGHAGSLCQQKLVSGSLCERLRTGPSSRVTFLKFSPWNIANPKKGKTCLPKSQGTQNQKWQFPCSDKEIEAQRDIPLS